ncbi:firelighter isoform X2 [Rhodnius prolixus]|uniref:firelighter isoform X2 n=1 Tax=Rhodnius prolixus TaxID=13249 RepID=UPI003D18BBE8
MVQWEENTMLLRLYSIGILFLDILSMMLKACYASLEAIYLAIIPPAEKSVAGEIVLVTGAGHGIGQELAVQFGELGAVVVCLDINEKGNEETIQLLKEKGCTRAHAYKCDVTSREEVLATVDRITKEVGAVTVLVNNAGIMPCHRFLDHKPEEIKKMFDVNILSHFWLLEAVLPDMVNKNHGHIVALSSIAGLVGLKNLVPYCATKFAVKGLMESLIEEFREEGKAPDVKFTCIFPYMVNTGLCKKPKIRFEGVMGLVSPKDCASDIIKAMRRNALGVTIPSFLLVIHDVVRLFPHKVGQIVKDFCDSGVEAVD